MFEKGASVLLVAHSQFRGVYSGIAKMLYERYGASVHLYVGNAQQGEAYAKLPGDFFASIDVASDLYATCRAPVSNPQEVIATARANEDELGVTINQLAMLDRHLGRGYALGGSNHPRSRLSENTSYAQMLAGYNSEIAYWRREIEDKQPCLVLNPGKILSVLARAKSLPARYIAGSRFRNYHYWSCDEFECAPSLDAALDAARPEDAPPFDEPYVAYQTYIQRFKEDTSHWRTGKFIAMLIARHVYWRMRGYEKARGYYLGEEIAYAWRRRQATARMTHPSLPRLQDLKGKPFIFFPLATEPERALQGLSPEYPYQLTAIASLSRDMPAGYELIVKEHRTATGRRPDEFYDQISEFRNVRIMNMAEHGFDVVREAAGVATISGTAGFEGAALGKPVITFGRHNLYNALDHVMVVSDESQIKGFLERIVDGSVDPGKAKRDGQKFLKAVIDISYDLKDFEPWEPERVDADVIAEALDNLLGTLPQSSVPAGAVAS